MSQPSTRRVSSVWLWTVLGVVALSGLQWASRNPNLIDGYVRGILLLAGINITLAVSLNIINGMTGQFSIGHAGFMAIGAYVGVAVTVFGGTALERLAAGGAIDPQQPVLNLFLRSVGGSSPGVGTVVLAQLWFWGALLVAGFSAAAAGILVGIPTLRLRGDYLAIATLGFGEIVRVGLLNFEAMGGASGFNGRPPFNCIPPLANLFNVYLVALVCVVVAATLKRSAHGRALLAIREDEVAAEAVGIDTTRYKVFAFALSAFFAGVAGALMAHDQGNVNPANFTFMRSIEAIVMVVLGGSGSTTGCVLAAFLLTGLREGLRDLADYRMVLYAEILIVMMLVRRQGLLGSGELTSEQFSGWWRFFRREGTRGLRRAAGARWRGGREALRERLRRPGQPPWLAWLAGATLLLPAADLLAAWWLTPATQPYPRTYAAEIVSSLSQLLAGWMHANPWWRAVVGQLALPLPPNAGLSVALLILVVPWTAMAFGLATGDRRAGWGLWTAGALAVWHGLGLLRMGLVRPRTIAEVVGGSLLVVAAAVYLTRRRR